MPFPPDAQDKPGQQPGVYFNGKHGFTLLAGYPMSLLLLY